MHSRRCLPSISHVGGSPDALRFEQFIHAACWSNDNPNDVFIEDLNRHDPYQRPTAAARNTAYIAEQRRLLRKLLRKARREKRLPHGEALCAEFADPKKQASSSKPEEVISLLDDELDDDEQSKWHKKRTSLEELYELNPNDDLVQMLVAKRRQVEEDEATKAAVHEEMSVRMDTGVRVNPALKAALLGDEEEGGGGSGGVDLLAAAAEEESSDDDEGAMAMLDF